jgi:4-hydroxy-2-oxoheptanedioate aldolase
MDHPTLATKSLGTRLRSGEQLFAAWCGIPEIMVAETIARAGYDTIIFDMQHGAIDIVTAIRGINAVALVGTPAIVRIPVGDFASASRMLDAGAAAVIAPMINSVDDARRFASYAKFPPMGERSWGPARAMTLAGNTDQIDYLHTANQDQLAIAMVETLEAVKVLDDILQVPGIDGVLVGASDLSIALSNGGTIDMTSPDVLNAVDRIVASCRTHNKVAMMACKDSQAAKEMSVLGFQVTSMANDTTIITRGVHALLSAARSA